MMDLTKLKIKTDENFVDENGDPRKDAEIYKNYILCHPSMKESLIEAINFFLIKEPNQLEP